MTTTAMWSVSVGVLASVAMGCACESTPSTDVGVPALDAANDAAATDVATTRADAFSVADDAITPSDSWAGRDSGPVTCAPIASLEAYYEAAAEVGCRYIHECQGGRTSRSSGSSCRSDATDLERYRAAIADGRVRFDGEAACACLSLYGPDCEVDFRAFASCLQVLVPTAPEGRCNSPDDCGFGTCELSEGMCPGRCAAGAGGSSEGEPCGASVRCELGLVCGRGGTCVVGPALGEPCMSAGDCSFSGAGAWCETAGSGMPGVCRPGRALGEGCGFVPGVSSVVLCAPPAVCTSGVCVEGASEGQACGFSAGCAAGLWCSSGACVPSRAPDESCAADGDCPTGFACAGTCVPLPVVGEPCPEGRCWGGACVAGECAEQPNGAACDGTAPFRPQCEGRCDATSMTCVAASGDGGTCTSAIDCAAGLTCLGSQCRAPCAP